MEKNGYVAVKDDAEAYVSNDMKGTITIGGSSSVTPIMEKLAEVYMELNPKVTVDVQQSDSTTGMNAVRDGIMTHNMQQAMRIADRTAFFLMGEVIETDETVKLFSCPADKRTEDYIMGRFG